MSSTEIESFDPRPGTVSVVLTVAPAVLAAVASAATLPSTAAGLTGVILLPIGVQRGSRLLHRLGTAGLFAGVLLAGAAGAPPITMLIAAGAAVVAWDAGEHGIGLGEQLGSAAAMARTQVTHTGATAAVGTAVAVVGYFVYQIASSGQPTTAVVLLLVAALLFTFLLDR